MIFGNWYKLRSSTRRIFGVLKHKYKKILALLNTGMIQAETETLRRSDAEIMLNSRAIKSQAQLCNAKIFFDD